MVEDALLIQKIKLIFGEDAYQNGSLNRIFISSQAFQNKHLLEQLNGAVHPAVYKDFDDWCSKQKSTYIIKEAALMFESESYKQLDKIIVVTAPEELRIERAMKRDSISRDAVLSRMKNQMSEEQKLSLGQFEIKNNEVELLIPQVLELNKQFGAV
jgi:dephospho-CoA kinase